MTMFIKEFNLEVDTFRWNVICDGSGKCRNGRSLYPIGHSYTP